MADIRSGPEIEEDRGVEEALRRTEAAIAELESVQYPDHREHYRLLALEKARGRAGEFASTKAITYLARRVRKLQVAARELLRINKTAYEFLKDNAETNLIADGEITNEEFIQGYDRLVALVGEKEE